VVVNRDCGCFWKFYFEIETDGLAVDSERDRCETHKRGIDGDFEAALLARERADRIRASAKNSN